MNPAPAVDVRARWAVLQGRRGRLLAGMMVMEVVAATQVLIVVTVLPQVVHDIGGVRWYGAALAATALAGIAATPTTARALSRYGARGVLTAGTMLFTAGAAAAGLAPSMQVLVAGRFAEGAATSAVAAVTTTGVAALYEQQTRPAVVAMQHLAWALPSVAGPALGGIAVATIGWRWAFLLPIAVLAAALALVAPVLDLLGPVTRRPSDPVWPAVMLLAGVLGLLLGPLTAGGPMVRAAVMLSGVGLGCVAVQRMVRTPSIAPTSLASGSAMSRRPRLPAVTLAMFCCTFAFFAVDGFVPLQLTTTGTTSVAAAGTVVTLATAGWTLAGAVQARLRWQPNRLVASGAALILAGIAGTAAGLAPPLRYLPFAAWSLGGFGMGLAYSGLWLAAMHHTPLTGPMITDRLGTALGTTAGGSFLALSPRAGIATGLAVAAGAAAVLLATSHRLHPTPGD